MNKNILIVSYTFPPSVEVGGRRWWKFGKAITEIGYNVHVISSNIGIGHSKLSEINNSIFSRYVFENRYPEILGKEPKRIIDKINYRWALNSVKKKSLGNYYDRGIYCENELLKMLEKVFSTQEIDKVIVTGAPFSLLYYLSNWKEKFNYYLIADIRDPWISGESYGIRNLSEDRIAEERRREATVMNHSDLICVPNLQMKLDLEELYPSYESKIIVLPHGYDEEEFAVNESIVRNSNKWVYGGTVYSESDEDYRMIFNYIESSEGIHLDIYCRNTPSSFGSYEQVTFKEVVTPFEFNKICQCSSAFLWVFPEKFKDYFSTKFYELVRCHIPIIYVGHEGQFSRFLVQNDLGIFIDSKKNDKEIPDIDKRLKMLNYNYKFPIEEYEVKNLVRLFLS